MVGSPFKAPHREKKRRREFSQALHGHLELWSFLTKQDHKVIENTRSRVKIKSKLTNFKSKSRIEGYNDKQGSNRQGIRENFYDLFEFDQIG